MSSGFSIFNHNKPHAILLSKFLLAGFLSRLLLIGFVLSLSGF